MINMYTFLRYYIFTCGDYLLRFIDSVGHQNTRKNRIFILLILNETSKHENENIINGPAYTKRGPHLLTAYCLPLGAIGIPYSTLRGPPFYYQRGLEYF